MQTGRNISEPLSTSIPSISLKACRDITKKIYNYPIAKYFRQPVDEKNDNAPGYYEKIKRPMDLGTVLKKLDQNGYKNLREWKEDMNLIWNNSLEYNHPDTPIHWIAQELKDICHKLSDHIPSNEIEKWSYSCKKKHEKLVNLLYFVQDSRQKLRTSNPIKPTTIQNQSRTVVLNTNSNSSH